MFSSNSKLSTNWSTLPFLRQSWPELWFFLIFNFFWKQVFWKTLKAVLTFFYTSLKTQKHVWHVISIGKKLIFYTKLKLEPLREKRNSRKTTFLNVAFVNRKFLCSWRISIRNGKKKNQKLSVISLHSSRTHTICVCSYHTNVSWKRQIYRRLLLTRFICQKLFI